MYRTITVDSVKYLYETILQIVHRVQTFWRILPGYSQQSTGHVLKQLFLSKPMSLPATGYDIFQMNIHSYDYWLVL